MSHINIMNPESYEYTPPSAPSRIIITTDHATNHVPEWINGGDLGISPEDMNRHIAYDVGALGVAKSMQDALTAHLIHSCFSRLTIDPNRGQDDPTLIMQIYDRTIIPANRALSPSARQERLNRLYLPYHQRLGTLISSITNPIIIAIHSFTPQLKGRPPRPWHIGILSAEDRRLAAPYIEALENEGQYTIGDNEPYKGALKGDTLDQHGIHNQIPHLLIEIRNDLISTPEDQTKWGQYLARHFTQTLQQTGL